MEFHLVGSPIKRTQCEKMNDAAWLSAIKHYSNDNCRRYGRDFIDGGASQIAVELQEATKKQPARFSDLSLKITDTVNPYYVGHILSGLAETEASDESLDKAVKRAHQHAERPFGREIARLLEKHPHIAYNAEILQILIWYALNGEAGDDDDTDKKDAERQTIAIETLLQRGSSFFIRGVDNPAVRHGKQ